MAVLRTHRYPAACALALVLAAGCRPAATLPVAAVRPNEHARRSAPRLLDVPAGLRRLSDRDQADEAETGHVPVQYEQPSGVARAGPRIRELSTTPGPSLGGPIVEPRPVSQEPAGPALAPPSPVVEPPGPSLASPEPAPISPPDPIVMPETTQPPPVEAIPDLPEQPPVFASPSTTGVPPAMPYASSPPAPAPWQPAAAQPPVYQPPVAQAPQMPSDRAWTPPPTVESLRSAPQTAQNLDAMQAVNQRAMQMADQATAMAQRGMLFSARAELIKALQLLTQAADAQEGTNRHTASLAAALVALAEAREFTAEGGRPGEVIDVPAVAARHRTPLLRTAQDRSISPIVAQQRYFGFAQEQLTFAAGQSACASQILYRLGRLQTAMAAHDADPLALHGPQAMVFHQAALVADASNYLAANELGVLLARYGQLGDAKRLLVQSVSLRPHLAGWQNLAFVHRRLGETDLASKAEHELKLLDQQNQKSPGGDTDIVRWVDSKTFAASPGGDVHWPAATDTKTATAPTSTTRR